MSVTMSCVIVTGILRGAFIVKLLYSIAPTVFSSFFFNDTATTEIYTLSLHDALPISELLPYGAQRFILQDDHKLPVVAAAQFQHRTIRIQPVQQQQNRQPRKVLFQPLRQSDRKSTRLNSSHT